MLSNKRLIAFIIYSVCLLGIPAKMIWDQNNIFHEGTAFKFKCAPIDPNDPFRGKYIRLGFEEIKIPNNGQINSNSQSFGIISIDEDGYAYIEDVTGQISGSQPMVEVYLSDQNDYFSYYQLPFDRLYMNENKAQAAEDLYRDALTSNTKNVYAKVYITNGRYLLDDVYVDDIKLKDAIQ